MLTLGFGFSLYDDNTKTYERKFFGFGVPGMTSEEFEDLDQAYDHEDRDEWDDVFGEAAAVGTIDVCDFFSSMSRNYPDDWFLWADYNVKVPDEKLLRGCEILRGYFITKGMECTAIEEISLPPE